MFFQPPVPTPRELWVIGYDLRMKFPRILCFGIPVTQGPAVWSWESHSPIVYANEVDVRILISFSAAILSVKVCYKSEFHELRRGNVREGVRSFDARTAM